MSNSEQAELMTVGELARRTGVPVKNLRAYTDIGLIYTVGRSPSNYRLFDTDALWCVRWIRELRGLGLTIAEIRELSDAHGDRPGPQLAERLQVSRQRLSVRIADLQQTLRRIDAFETAHREELTCEDEACRDCDARCPVCT